MSNHINALSAIIIGSPPAYRGSDLPGADIELKLIKYFPGVALFVEKPVATGPVERSLKVAKAIKESGAVCSVGCVPNLSKNASCCCLNPDSFIDTCSAT